jgi:transposase-like protein
MLKAALERGLEVELTEHVGYERGDPDAPLFPNTQGGRSHRRHGRSGTGPITAQSRRPQPVSRLSEGHPEGAWS